MAKPGGIQDDGQYHLVKDPIHGSIELHPLLYWITKTPAFHRLKYVKQLSGLHYIYPGGTHTRFEHSIGVCHLAGEYAHMLIKKYREEEKSKSRAKAQKRDENHGEPGSEPNIDDISKDELQKKLEKVQKELDELKKAQKESEKLQDEDEINILCIQIAGLCHDLGHGPFSHLFEPILKKYANLDGGSKQKAGANDKSGEKVSHEKLSTEILEKLIYKKNVKVFEKYHITEAHIQKIKDMIERPENFDSTREDLYLYQIVANKETGIDVDKWDYFIRDCHYIGLQHEFDCKRMMQLSKVRLVKFKEKNQLRICYNEKEVNNLLGMFRTRCSLHLKAYQHRRVRAVNHMLQEAMREAIDIDLIYDRTKGVKRSINDILSRLGDDLGGYLYLDDGIIHIILNMKSESMHHKEKLESLKQLEVSPLKKNELEKQIKTLEEQLATSLKLKASQKWLTDLQDDKIPHRLSPEKVAKNLHDVRYPKMDSQKILDVIEEHADSILEEIREDLKKEGILSLETDKVYVEKVKISCISEEGEELKNKAEVMSIEQPWEVQELKQSWEVPVVSTPLKEVYVYKDDMKSDTQKMEEDEEIIYPQILEEKMYEETLPLFIPERYKMERYWWYTTLNAEHDDAIIDVIAKVLKPKLAKWKLSGTQNNRLITS